MAVGVRHLPQEMLLTELPALLMAAVDNDDMDLEAAVATLEKKYLHKALDESVGNKAKAARLLKISERTLWYKLKKYGLTAGNPEQ
jgi:two-component system response regulator AtoC